MKFVGRGLRILDFDVEARPLSWYGGDWVTKEIIAIACQFVDRKRPTVWLLGEDDPVDMLEGFREFYTEAGMVTGHFIRGYDLPVINGAMLEYGLEPLDEKLTQDTKLDLVKRSGLSVSQENLASTLGIESPKIQMTQDDWREAGRLTPRGRKLVRERVTADVEQHMEMRAKLLERELLRPPKVWRPHSSGVGNYHP